MPEVSVIIPTYNRAAFLEQAIRSVLGQTFPYFELIIVDDGSTDNTSQVVHRFADSRIIYHSTTSQEKSAARNIGASLSSGKYLAFLDDDDCYLPQKLELQTRALRDNPHVGMVIAGWDRVNQSGGVVRSERPWLHHPLPDLKDWLFEAMAHVGSVLIQQSWFFRVGGFNQNLTQAEDTFFWFSLANAGCPILWNKDIVLIQRLHDNNTVRDFAEGKKNKLIMLDAVFADHQIESSLGVDRKYAYARVYLGCAHRAYATGSYEEAKADLSKATMLDRSLLGPRPDRLLESVAAFAWSQSVKDPKAFTLRVFSNLPEDLKYLKACERAAVARTWMVGAFRAFRSKEFEAVTARGLKAIASDPLTLRNRGFASIFLKSLMRIKRWPFVRAAASRF